MLKMQNSFVARSPARLLGFHSFFELGDQLRQRLGQRDFPGVTVIGAQPLTQNLTDVALGCSIEQGQIVRGHGAFLRGAFAFVVCGSLSFLFSFLHG